MPARVLHVSDLHAGRSDMSQTLPALAELVPAIEPELLVATGDLAHRGRLSELERARELLQALGVPLLAVPGNHDIPYAFPARFSRTLAAWELVFGTPEPVYTSEELFVAGLNSVRPARQQGGALSEHALARAAERLGGAPDGTLRVVALHHQLAAPPWRPGRKKPIIRRDRVLHLLAEAGAELVLNGHVHQAAIADRREFEVLADGARSVVLASAPGLGRPRPRRRGEACGFNVYDVDESTLTVTTHAWDGGGTFVEVGRRTFARR